MLATTPRRVVVPAQQKPDGFSGRVGMGWRFGGVAVRAFHVVLIDTPHGSQVCAEAVYAPDSGASNTADTSAEKPSSSGDVAAAPREKTPCST